MDITNISQIYHKYCVRSIEWNNIIELVLCQKTTEQKEQSVKFATEKESLPINSEELLLAQSVMEKDGSGRNKKKKIQCYEIQGELYNCTGYHTVLVNGRPIKFSGECSRVKLSQVQIGTIDGIPVMQNNMHNTRTVGLPDYKPGVFYIVSFFTAINNITRGDLLVPNPDGKSLQYGMLKCKSLLCLARTFGILN
jgi:hypothetical protein